jgi:NTE family protein/lysophospholipid hydrolase
MAEKNKKTSVDDLRRHLSDNALFKGLDQTVIEGVADASERIVLGRDRTLFRQGEPADAMYVLIKGCLGVAVRGEDGVLLDIAEIRPGQVVGEIQVLTGGKRTATVQAKEESDLVKITRIDFDLLAGRQKQLVDRMNNIVRQRLRHNQFVRFMPPLFGSLTDEQLHLLEEEAEWIDLECGKALFHQGDPGDSFFVLMSGTMGVVVTGGGRETQTVDRIRRGEIIGEMALLSDEDRSASVVALRDSELIRFSKDKFRQLLAQHPDLLLQITRLLIARLRRVHTASDRPSECSILAVVPASPDVPAREFSARLAGCLSRLGSTIHVNDEELDSQLGTPGISQVSDDDPNHMRIIAWFSSQAEKHRYLLCQTDAAVTNWTKRCLRQADRIVVVGNATGDSSLCEIERELLYGPKCITRARSTLVLIHPDGSRRPSGTAKWLGNRDVEMHHHLRWNEEKDTARLARFLAGSAVGLVLGGGGARGFAHLGVLRALEELGIPVELLGGASMGALLGAPYAMGWDAKTTETESISRINTNFFDVTFPLTSLLAGRKFVQKLKDFFGDVSIEDLWLPYFCISSNMSRAEIEVHREGALWLGLRASNGAPGILPPLVIDGDLYIDGGILSNVPADVMKGLCKGKVIAIDVSPSIDLSQVPCYGDYLSGWRILWSRINPFMKSIQAPHIASVLMRSAEIASVAHQRTMIEKFADLHLCIPLDEYSIQDYGSSARIAEAGYRFAKPRLEDWMETGLDT